MSGIGTLLVIIGVFLYNEAKSYDAKKSQSIGNLHKI